MRRQKDGAQSEIAAPLKPHHIHCWHETQQACLRSVPEGTTPDQAIGPARRHRQLPDTRLNSV
jgi:hypothetical protein